MAGSSNTPQFWLAQMALIAAVVGLVVARFVRSPDPGTAILIAEGALWALFGVFCALFGGTVLVALAYLWLD